MSAALADPGIRLGGNQRPVSDWLGGQFNMFPSISHSFLRWRGPSL